MVTQADLNAGQVVSLTLNMSEAMNVTGTPKLTLNNGGITANFTTGGVADIESTTVNNDQSGEGNGIGIASTSTFMRACSSPQNSAHWPR